MDRKALLVIDMLFDFLDPGGALYVGEAGREIIPFVAQAVERSRREEELVIYLCDSHRPDDAEFRMFPPHCLVGTKGATVIPELSPHPGDYVISKRRYSGFFGTDLDATLREHGVTELTCVGVCTNICVLYTAADARMLNYQVKVPQAGVASFDQAAHAFALQELAKTLGVEVV